MFPSTILDVIIGIVFSFLAVSLIASVVVEAISSMMKWRSDHLLEGIKQLVNDPGLSGLALKLYQHAAVNPRGILPASQTKSAKGGWFAPVVFKASRPAEGAKVDLRNAPAYVHGLQFAGALMDFVGLSGAGQGDADPALSIGAMKAALNDLVQPAEGGSPAPIQADPQIHQLLTGIVERSDGEIEKVQKQIAAWFDNGMDRLSGAYKRRTQSVTFVIGLVLAVSLNVDTVRIAHVLWLQPTLVDDLKLKPGGASAICPPAQPAQNATAGNTAETSTSSGSGAAKGEACHLPPNAENALKVLEDHLPVGWSDLSGLMPHSIAQGLLALLGWLITAFATLFGAPFWFDALQSFVRLKGTGPSPKETVANRAAAA